MQKERQFFTAKQTLSKLKYQRCLGLDPARRLCSHSYLIMLGTPFSYTGQPNQSLFRPSICLPQIYVYHLFRMKLIIIIIYI